MKRVNHKNKNRKPRSEPDNCIENSDLRKRLGSEHLLFAVSTPGGVKLNHPNVFTVKNVLVKAVVRQLDHVFLT